MLDTHLILSSLGQLEHELGPHLGPLAWPEPGASHCSPAALSKVREVRTASFPDRHSVHFLGSQEA